MKNLELHLGFCLLERVQLQWKKGKPTCEYSAWSHVHKSVSRSCLFRGLMWFLFISISQQHLTNSRVSVRRDERKASERKSSVVWEEVPIRYFFRSPQILTCPHKQAAWNSSKLMFFGLVSNTQFNWRRMNSGHFWVSTNTETSWNLS